MNSLMIIPATTEDVPALVALVNSGYRGDSSRQGWTTEADLLGGIRIDEESMTDLIKAPGSVVLKATDANGIIQGCVHLQDTENALYLGMLTVSPTLQNAGIGRQLMQAAEEFARTKNLPAITMTVISVREELIAWYQRRGYADTGERKPFPMNDPRFGLPKQPLEFIVMEKQLKPGE
ncbi:MAG: GNAT family N-acetyltransferase [Sphingobacteriales bacterium]|jgi:ribosomal protein S18 acetylase RimI-like enzyme|nr:GNAT family N-acetyltransferase [Sphingobacteriales bacterium]NCT74287.1 GNAT family N-acetyltransferase [Chitinophagaceae bacterium]OJW36674.1 MAG: GNAT family N-acetyltransferase [Sphingobacteriales bacterium 46-32]